MSLTLQYLGHSGFLLDDGSHRVAIDPFLTGNPLAPLRWQDVRVQSIVLTHGHDDHVGDAVAIARANSATVYCSFELGNLLAAQGCTVSQGNPGGQIATPFGFVAFTQAFHSNSYQGKPIGPPCGIIVRAGGVSVYHCGDTGLFSDMQLIGEIYRPAVACIPIGDRFTMGPALASRAADFIGAPIVVPIHYNTWPPIAQDPADVKPKTARVHALKPGEALTVN
jgi:L-ascorbate metabolism protein UlaG (beta-lactamase superfamily)